MSSLDTLNKRLLIALGTSEQTAQIVIDHIDELRTEAGKLRSEVICLKQDLHDATLGRCTCTDCGKVVGNAWRDSDVKPLYGNRGGRTAKTHWIVFLKP